MIEHSRGASDAPISIVEYLDFQCPHSAEAVRPLQQILEAYSGEVRLIVRQFPLTDIHDQAGVAAVASEAAALQGRFWEMHDLLFSRQDELGLSAILDIASELGLDMEQFTEDLRDPQCQERVNADIREAERMGVDETPTFFINGTRLRDRPTFTALSRAVAGLLRSAA